MGFGERIQNVGNGVKGAAGSFLGAEERPFAGKYTLTPNPVTVASSEPARIGMAAAAAQLGISGAKTATSPFSKSYNWSIILAFVLLFMDMKAHFFGFDVSHFLRIYSVDRTLEIFRLATLNIFILLGFFSYMALRVSEKSGKKESVFAITLAFVAVLLYSFFMKIPFAFQSLWELLAFFLFIVYLYSMKPSSDDAFATFLLILVILNLYHFGFFYGMAAIHITYAILFYFFTLRRATDNSAGAKYALILLIGLDLFLPNVFGGVSGDVPLRYAVPFWLLLSIGFSFAIGGADWFNVLSAIGLIGMLLILSGATPQIQRALFPEATGDENVLESIRNKTKDPRTWFQRFYDEFVNRPMNESIRYGSGQDYYTSKIDENSKKRLGVYIEDFNANEKDFYDNERIILDATLTAENFADEEDEDSDAINIQLSCDAYKEGKFAAKGKIYPSDHYNISRYDVENIECIFDPWMLKQGIYEIKLKAQFNFKTEAYLKRYFVDKERVRILKRNKMIKEDTDILKLNKIDDINPIAKNSVGPVQIKVSDRIPAIIQLEEINDVRKIFATSFENTWKGKIGRTKNIQFFLPEGITLDSGQCVFAMKDSPLPNYEKYEGYTLFELEQSRNPRLENVEKSVEQSCGLLIRASERKNLLEPGEVTTRYFRFIVDYDYLLEEKINVNVKEPEEFHVRMAAVDDKPVHSGAAVKCIAKNKENINGQVTFALYEKDNEVETATIPCLDKSCEYTFEKAGIFQRGTQLTCEAIINDQGNYTAKAYTIVQNSAPEIKNVSLEPNEVLIGENMLCSVAAADNDYDDIIVTFKFEGINIAPAQKECNEMCSAEFPTDSLKNSTSVKCIAMAYDGQERSEIKTAEGKVKSI